MSIVRGFDRFVPVLANDSLALRVGRRRKTVRLEDISCRGAFCQGARGEIEAPVDAEIVWESDRAVEIHRIRLDRERGVKIKIRTILPSPRDMVVVFDEMSALRLKPVLESMKARNLITDDHNRALTRRQIDAAHIRTLKAAAVANECDDGEEVVIDEWVSKNRGRLGQMSPDAWRKASAAIDATFSSYFIGPNRFRKELVQCIQKIIEKAGDAEIHVVPMRMPTELSKIIADNGARFFEERKLNWHPSLWQFLRQIADLPPSDRRCLVGLDTYLNDGLSRRQFLRLMLETPGVVTKFSQIVPAAVISHSDLALDFEVECARLNAWNIAVDFVAGSYLDSSARSSEWDSLLEQTGLQSWQGISHMPKKAPSLVVFYYGAPFSSVPLYWKDTEQWHPLFRPLEYYNPSHRPIAVAPFFCAYPSTLRLLEGKVASGGAAVLFGERGYGKTYLAARLAENARASSYVFWYKCRAFDSVDALIGHLDEFLRVLGIELPISKDLYSLGEAEVARQFVDAIRRLDRPALLIFDAIEHLDLLGAHETRHASDSLADFVRHLIAALTLKSDGTIAEPFLLLTHHLPGPREHHPLRVDISGDLYPRTGLVPRFIAALSTKLGLPSSAFITIGDDDTFLDPVPLARKILRNAEAIKMYASELHDPAHLDPYRAWLLCYWINRCVRRAKRDMLAEGPGATRQAGVEPAVSDEFQRDEESLRAARPEIEELLARRQAPRFKDIDVLHEEIYERLDEPEQRFLEIASAWRLPWSGDEIGDVMSGLGHVEQTANSIVNDLLRDRSPFLIKLRPTSQRRPKGPFNLLLRPHDADSQRFEMPSIAKEFFGRRLQDRAPTERAGMHAAMARSIDQRITELEGAQHQRISDQVRRTMLRIDGISYWCLANKVKEAAERFSHDLLKAARRHNSWDNFLQQGALILEAAAAGGLEPELHCELAVINANAFTESFRLDTARAICASLLKSEPRIPDEYWTLRLRLIEAKCLRYENRYAETLSKLAEVEQALREMAGNAVSRDEAFTWLGRTRAAMTQCHMSFGRLDDAEAALKGVDECADALAPHKARVLRGLALRHRGTIQFLRGYIYDDGPESAYVTFQKLLDGANLPPGEDEDKRSRVTVITLYKQARVLVERVREWETPLMLHQADPSASESIVTPDKVEAWLQEIDTKLSDARSLLRRSDRGDRKWFPAIELAEAEASLIRRRLGLSPAPDQVQTADELLRRMPSDRQEGRSMEITMLSQSLGWQDQIEDGTSHPAFVTELVPSEADLLTKQQNELTTWEVTDGNPYKLSRIEYERMHYLWRWITTVNVSGERDAATQRRLDRAIEAAAMAYRRGTSLLYARGMALSANALHRLALVCFRGRRVSLQERLEAAMCLRLDPATHVHRVLEQIAIEALAAPSSGEPDLFFTVPTKVMCRLLGAHPTYVLIKNEKRQPAEGLKPATGRDPQLISLAKKLALECDRWHVRLTDETWNAMCVRAKVPDFQRESRIATVRDHVRQLARCIEVLLVET